jgi:hypothetical protein
VDIGDSQGGPHGEPRRKRAPDNTPDIVGTLMAMSGAQRVPGQRVFNTICTNGGRDDPYSLQLRVPYQFPLKGL